MTGDNLAFVRDVDFKLMIEVTPDGFKIEVNSLPYAEYVYGCHGGRPIPTYMVIHGHVNVSKICFD